MIHLDWFAAGKLIECILLSQCANEQTERSLHFRIRPLMSQPLNPLTVDGIA
jgi:hypothetical protein